MGWEVGLTYVRASDNNIETRSGTEQRNHHVLRTLYGRSEHVHPSIKYKYKV
jgi:hypothetical protein